MASNSLIKFWQSKDWPVNESFDVYERLSILRPFILRGEGDLEVQDIRVRNPRYADRLIFSYKISGADGLYKMPISLYGKKYMVLFYKKDDRAAISTLKNKFGLKDTDEEFAKRGFWIYAEVAGISGQEISIGKGGRYKVVLGSLVSSKLLRDAHRLFSEVIINGNRILENIGDVIKYLVENERIIWVKGLKGPARYQAVRNLYTGRYELYVLLNESLRDEIFNLSDKGKIIRIAKELVHEATEILLEGDWSDPERRKTEEAAVIMETIFLNLVHNTHIKWTTRRSDSGLIYIGRSRYLRRVHEPNKKLAIDVLFKKLSADIYGLLQRQWKGGIRGGADSNDKMDDGLGTLHRLFIRLLFDIVSYDRDRNSIVATLSKAKFFGWIGVAILIFAKFGFIYAAGIVIIIAVSILYLFIYQLSVGGLSNVTSDIPKKSKFLTGIGYIILIGLISTGGVSSIGTLIYLVYSFVITPLGQVFSIFILLSVISVITFLLIRNTLPYFEDITLDSVFKIIRKTAYNIFVSPFEEYFNQDIPESPGSYHIRQNRTKQMLALCYYRGMAISAIFHLLIYYLDSAVWLYKISLFFFMFFSLAAIFAFMYAGIIYLIYKIDFSMLFETNKEIVRRLSELNMGLDHKSYVRVSSILTRKISGPVKRDDFIFDLGRFFADIRYVQKTYEGVEFFVRTESDLLWDFLRDGNDRYKIRFRKLLVSSVFIRGKRLFISNEKGEILILEGENITPSGQEQKAEMAGRLLSAFEEIDGGIRGYRSRVNINGLKGRLLTIMEVPCGNGMKKSIAVIHPSTSLKETQHTARLYDMGGIKLEKREGGSTGAGYISNAIPKALFILTHPEFKLFIDDLSGLQEAYIKVNVGRTEALIQDIESILLSCIPELSPPIDGAIMQTGSNGEAFKEFQKNREYGRYNLLSDRYLENVQRVARNKGISLDRIVVYAINSIVRARNDFLHGYFDRGRNELFLSMDIMGKASLYDLENGTKLLDEYIEHELRCTGNNHQDLRRQQRQDYMEYGNYSDANDEGRLRDVIRKYTDIAWQRFVTRRFIDKVKAIPAKQEKKRIILALDTDIGNMTQFEIGKLLEQIRDVSSLWGNIEFISDKGEELAVAIKDAVGGRDNIDVIVVTKREKKEFDKSYNILRVDDKQIGDSGSYIPILELLTFALVLNYGDDIVLLKQLYNEIADKELTDGLIGDIRQGEFAIPLLPKPERIPVDYYNESVEVLKYA